MSQRTAIEIWQELEAKGARVRWRPVSQEAIDAAEKELAVRLPPSYVALVTTLGAPAVLPRLPPRVDPTDPVNLDHTVLTPAEIVEYTFELRDSVEPELFDDAEAAERARDLLDEALFFQFGLDAGEGYVFLLDTQSESGEMKTADYSHDYLDELDWGPDSKVVFASFDAAQERVAAQILESWTEYADT